MFALSEDYVAKSEVDRAFNGHAAGQLTNLKLYNQFYKKIDAELILSSQNGHKNCGKISCERTASVGHGLAGAKMINSLLARSRGREKLPQKVFKLFSQWGTERIKNTEWSRDDGQCRAGGVRPRPRRSKANLISNRRRPRRLRMGGLLSLFHCLHIHFAFSPEPA